MARPVAIDTDFLLHLAETQGEKEKICGLIRAFFQGLEVEPEYHELLFRHELPRENPVVLKLFQERALTIRALADIVTNRHAAGGRYYERVVKELYHEMTGEDYPCDVFEGWVRKRSLGEVHCVAMCFFLGYDCLLSDDRDAGQLQRITDSKLSFPVRIYSRRACRDYLQEHGDKHSIPAGDLKRLCHIRT